MLKEIMVPLDGTRFAEAALPTAVALARRDAARLRLVAVTPRLSPQAARYEWEEEAHIHLEAYLEGIAKTTREVEGVPVTVEVLEGDASEVLPRRGAELGVDLAVMTTHGRGPVTRAWLGSVADRTVREATFPVLLIRPDEEEPWGKEGLPRPLRRILLPMDGSGLAEAAIEPAIRVGGRDAYTSYTLLRVVPTHMAPPYVPESVQLQQMTLEEGRRAAHAQLAALAERMAEAHDVPVVTEVVHGAPVSPAIVHFAEDQEVDLIAMATHGRSGFARTMLGSVADKVLRTSPVPVLLYRPVEAPTAVEEGEPARAREPQAAHAGDLP